MLILGRTLVTRAPPQALRRGVRVGGCGCGRTAAASAVMAELGMVTQNGDLTDATWPPHIAEERALLFPKLAELGRAYSDPAVAQALARLEDDHRVYLALLADGLPLPPWPDSAHSTADHAALEDLLVATYAAPLRLMAGGMTAEQAKVRVSLAPRAAVSTAGSTGIAFAPRGGGAPSTAAASTHRASWAPWLLATAAGAAGWWLFGPLAGVAALGGTVVTAKVVESVAAPPHRPAGDSAPPPPPFSDPSAYFAAVQAQADDVHKTLAARQDESDERVRKWKEAFKEIPLLGPFTGALVDIGAWFGKVLGGNYAEENSPEDVQHAADGAAKWLQVGLIPPLPQFTAKNGAAAYGREMDRGLELLRVGPDKSPADNLSARALSTMATMTILHAGCPEVRRAIAEVGQGNGSLRGVGWYGSPPKLVGFETVVAALASCAYHVPYEAAFAYARKVTDHASAYPVQPGLATDHFADAFTEVMRAAARGEIR